MAELSEPGVSNKATSPMDVLRDLEITAQTFLMPQVLGPRWWWSRCKAWKEAWYQGQSDAADWMLQEIRKWMDHERRS